MRTRRIQLAALLFHLAAFGLFAWAAHLEPGLRPVLACWGLGLFGHALYVWAMAAPHDTTEERRQARLEVERALAEAARSDASS